jgi:GntR family transcriptional regulator
VWQHIVVDRRDHASPYRQIANAIRHRIATHQVAANAPLPSVRALAEQTGVTPATVARAYRQLQDDGLVESQVGVGTVVSDTRRLVFQAKRRSIEELDRSVDTALTPLLQLGYGPSEVRQAVERRLGMASETRNAIFVSDARVIVDKYVAIMSRELGALGVTVHGMLLDELVEGSDAVKQRLANTNRVLTALGLLQRVRHGLERIGANPPLSIIFTELSLATIEKLTAISKDKIVLLVSQERYRNSVLGILFQHIPHENVVVLHKLDAATLEEELERAHVVVHSFGTTELVRAAKLGDRQVIVMEYQVRPDAMEKLRESFGVEAGG